MYWSQERYPQRTSRWARSAKAKNSICNSRLRPSLNTISVIVDDYVCFQGVPNVKNLIVHSGVYVKINQNWNIRQFLNVRELGCSTMFVVETSKVRELSIFFKLRAICRIWYKWYRIILILNLELVLKYYSLVPKCVDFPDGEVKEAKSLKLPYQFNNDDDIESRDPRTD